MVLGARRVDRIEALAAELGGTGMVLDVAECIRWAVSLPSRVNVDQIVVKPRDQADAFRAHRTNSTKSASEAEPYFVEVGATGRGRRRGRW